MDKGLKCDLPNFAASKFCPLLFHSFSIKEALSGMLVGYAIDCCKIIIAVKFIAITSNAMHITVMKVIAVTVTVVDSSADNDGR